MFNSHRNSTASNQPLANDQLRTLAPSIFAETAYHGMSSRYGFIPTIQVLEAIRGEGWFPVQAREQRVRLDDKRGFTRHIVRLRRPGTTLENVGDVIPEIVLLNSHDGSSAYQMHAGLFRLACANGLIVADSTFAKISIRHQGDVVGRVIEGAAEIVRDVPRIANDVRSMQAIELSDAERGIFAGSAIALRDASTPLEPAQVLQRRRYGDDRKDLWTTFNVVQENVIRGGLRSQTANGGRTRTRAVTSIQEDTRLNKALWTLAEEMAKLKAAA